MTDQVLAPPAPAGDVDGPYVADRVNQALAAQGIDWRVDGVEPLYGGASSLTFRGQAEGPIGPLAIKVAPAGLAPVKNRDVLRQARMLHAIADRPGIRVPTVHLEDPGDPPLAPPLFAMSLAEGETWEPLFYDHDGPLAPTVLPARAHAAARMLAALHAIDPAAVGFGDEPTVDLREEVERWAVSFASVADEALKPGADEVTRKLLEQVPEALPPAIVHGDFRLGNLVCDEGQITAVIDWEIWTCGDPRIDLAWFLLHADAAHPRATSVAPTLPNPAAIRATYEEAAGRPVPELDWFAALVRYKQAAISALIAKRNVKLGNVDERTRLIFQNNPLLLAWADSLLAP